MKRMIAVWLVMLMVMGGMIGIVNVQANMSSRSEKTPTWSYEGEQSPCRSVAISADGSFIASNNGDDGWTDYVYYFTKENNTPIWTCGGGWGYYTPIFAMGLDGNYLVTTRGIGYGDYMGFALYSCDSGEQLWYYSNSDYGGDAPRVSALAISQYGTYIGGGFDNHNFLFFKKDSGNPLWTFTTGGAINSISFSSNGSRFAIGSADNKVYFFSQCYYNTPDWSYETMGGVRSVSLSLDGRYIVAGGLDHRVYLFESNNSTPLWSYETGSYINQVAISPEGNYIVVGSADKRVYLFSKDNGIPIWNYTTGDHVYSVAISRNGEFIVAGGKDQKTYFFTKENSTPVWEYLTFAQINSVAISEDGNYVVAGDNNGYIYFFDNVGKPSILSSGIVSPSVGDINTVFYLNVTYSDPEGNPPVMKNVYIDGNPYAMTKISGEYTSGALYSYSTTLSVGSAHTYYFEFSDGIATVRLPTSGTYSGPTVTTVANQKPTVTITYPSSDTTVKGTMTVYGTSSDSDGAVQSVEVSIDDNTFATNKLTVTGTTSWSASWDTTQYTDGSHTIYVRAYDGTDYSTIKSVTVTVNQAYVNQAPTVTISSPTSDETVSGTITVSGSASDPDGVVSIVQIRIDTGSWKTVSGTTSWSYSWYTTEVSDGSHTISVRSSDGTDYSSVDSVNVNVKNEAEGKPFDISWLYIIIITVVVGILAIAGIGIKRRKKAQPPEKPAE